MKPTQTIEEKTLSEFDKKFQTGEIIEAVETEYGCEIAYGNLELKKNIGPLELKSFILSALSQMRESTIDECLGEIPEKTRVLDIGKANNIGECVGCRYDWGRCQCKGYNSAIDEITKRLNKLKKL